MKKTVSLFMVIAMIFSIINVTAYADEFKDVSVSFSTGAALDRLPKDEGSVYYTTEGDDAVCYADYETVNGNMCAVLHDGSDSANTALHIPFTPVSEGTLSIEANVCSDVFMSGLDIVKVFDSDGAEAAKCVVRDGRLALRAGGAGGTVVSTGVFQTTDKLQNIKLVFDFEAGSVKIDADGASASTSLGAKNVGEVVIETNKAVRNNVTVSSVSIYKGEEMSGGLVSDNPTLYIIGDSTGSPYTSSDYYKNGGNYLVMRNGFGMSFDRYFDSDRINIVNYAVSGISSKSFTSNKNYESMTGTWKKGDFLIIAFGHNDEKDSDEARFTNASMGADGYETEGQFAESLYRNYIKPAQDAGVKVILATPIIRRSRVSDTVTGSDKHDLTEKGFGDYSQTIRELADKLDLPCIDNTQMTYNEYVTLGRGAADGSDGYGAYHSQYSDDYMKTKEYFDEAGNIDENYRIDNTHLNSYGAAVVGYFMAQAIRGSEEPISGDNYAPVVKDDSAGTLSSLGTFLRGDYQDPRIEGRKADDVSAGELEGFSVYLDTETTLHDTLGETFDVYVKVKDSEGISNISYTLEYDTDILKLVSPETENADGKVLTEGTMNEGEELSDGDIAVYTFEVVGGGDTDVKLDVLSMDYNGKAYDTSKDFRTGSLNIVCDFNPEETNH